MKKHAHTKKATTSQQKLTLIVACIALLLAIYILFTITAKKTAPANNTAGTNEAMYPTTDPKQITSTLYFLKNSDKKIAYININTDKQPISGVQLALKYDPKAIGNIEITQGTFFNKPVVLQNAIDTTNGIIYYTLSINPNSAQIYGEGSIVTLHYQLINAGASTKITFLPQTKVTAKGINTSVLKQATAVQLP
ncbi:MAG TPA: cohesin domain-containing protein [Candidatus Saccharimonadales bacterium]|nr:cohesin domain-containing protein [Candidatus Saccharimonadales bacterium]